MTQTAIILAGGFGTRLQSVVSDLPKPMAPVNGRPFLDYQLQHLSAHGFKNVILSVGHLHEKITQHYGNRFMGLELHYAVERTALGTGGGIRLGMEACSDEQALVLNGDSLFKIDLTAFMEAHDRGAAETSLALRRVDNASRYGTIQLGANDEIISFREKSGAGLPGIINAGVYLLNRTAFLENTPAGVAFSIEKDYFEKKLGALKMKGFVLEGYFIDIGIPEDYSKAQHDFKGTQYR